MNLTEKQRLTIGLSRGSGTPKYANYRKWLEASGRENLEFVDFFVEDVDSRIDDIDGLILTGGGDIDPGRYGMPEAIDRCDGIVPERDDLEARLIEEAIERRIPILGICRGIQMVNVHFGGTLIPDLDEPLDARIHSKVEENDSNHAIHIEPGSLAHRAIGTLEGHVSSSHHQAVDRVAEGLVVTSRSECNIIEALEFREPEKKTWMIAVQWHPERMEYDDPLSNGLREAFLLETESASILKRSSMPLPKEEPEEIQVTDERSASSNGSTFDLPIVDN